MIKSEVKSVVRPVRLRTFTGLINRAEAKCAMTKTKMAESAGEKVRLIRLLRMLFKHQKKSEMVAMIFNR